MEQDLVRSFAQESRQDFPRAADGHVRYAHLALSGGGASGAFGAGFLNGWTHRHRARCSRSSPACRTGALMAPFAFLGPDYDGRCASSTPPPVARHLHARLDLLACCGSCMAGEALADTRPLQRSSTQPCRRRAAAARGEAHQRGRRLYIGTANLDAPRFVVWNMGLIASSGRPDALELFRKVMLASASIPVAFPPVFFEVELRPGGPRYDEMHVDGGVGARVSSTTAALFRASIIRERGGHGRGRPGRHLRHSQRPVRPAAQPTRRTVLGITTRVLDASSRVRRDWRPASGSMRSHRAKAQLSTGSPFPRESPSRERKPSIRSRCRRSTTWATGAPSPVPDGRRARRGSWTRRPPDPSLAFRPRRKARPGARCIMAPATGGDVAPRRESLNRERPLSNARRRRRPRRGHRLGALHRKGSLCPDHFRGAGRLRDRRADAAAGQDSPASAGSCRRDPLRAVRCWSSPGGWSQSPP